MNSYKIEIEQAANFLDAGELIAFPTETYYGLGADIKNRAAVRRLFQLKKRPPQKQVPVLIGELTQLADLAAEIPSPYQRLMDAFWPGALTLVFKAREHILPLISGHTGTIGVRLPASRTAREICLTFGGAVTATSANISGCRPALSKTEAEQQFGSRLSCIVGENGENLAGVGSTVAAMSGSRVKILRQGLVSSRDIEQVLSA